MVVIEMNPRVSRSSALPSKATGFPIAKIAARLAVGYTLDEIRNDITGETPASFEPAIDYVMTKVPRWAFEKFPGTPEILGTRMQSVGEAMAIGRNFPESLEGVAFARDWSLRFQPRSRRTPVRGHERRGAHSPGVGGYAGQAVPFGSRTPAGSDGGTAPPRSGVDPWFLDQISRICEERAHLESVGSPTAMEQTRLAPGQTARLSPMRSWPTSGARARPPFGRPGRAAT